MKQLLRMCVWPVLVTAVMVALLAGGCARDRSRAHVPEVIPISSGDVAAMSADDMARSMRRAGFSDAEILDLGPYVRNALATQGGARVRVGEKVEAIFALDGPRLHVTSRRTGSFIYYIMGTSD